MKINDTYFAFLSERVHQRTDWQQSWRTWGPRCLSQVPPRADEASTLLIETLQVSRLQIDGCLVEQSTVSASLEACQCQNMMLWGTSNTPKMSHRQFDSQKLPVFRFYYIFCFYVLHVSHSCIRIIWTWENLCWHQSSYECAGWPISCISNIDSQPEL